MNVNKAAGLKAKSDVTQPQRDAEKTERQITKNAMTDAKKKAGPYNTVRGELETLDTKLRDLKGKLAEFKNQAKELEEGKGDLATPSPAKTEYTNHLSKKIRDLEIEIQATEKRIVPLRAEYLNHIAGFGANDDIKAIRDQIERMCFKQL